jgi:cell filamentation protein
MADIYTYPGTDVLINKADIRDETKLRELEYAKTTRRAADAPTFPLSTAGYKDLHKHLFDEVYDWAGKTRTINFTKQGSDFARAASVSDELDSRFQRLGWDAQLRGLSPDRFAAGAAHHIRELNAIHPFREGNGRTMRVHLEQVAEQAGHRIDLGRMPKEEWNAASIKAHNGSLGDMTRLIQGAIEPRQHMTVDAAIERVNALREPAIQEIQTRTREIRDLVQAGKSSATVSKELSGLRLESLALVGPPGSNEVLSTLNQVKTGGGQEIASLASPSSSARDQIHAIHNAAIRSAVAQQRNTAAASPATRETASTSETAVAKPAAPEAPQKVAPAANQSKPAAYWSGVASQAPPKAEKPTAAGETAARSYKPPKA